MSHTLLISDLHLTAERPRINQQFFDFAEQVAPAAEALYILGDLFEYWVGDDDTEDPLNNRVAEALNHVKKLKEVKDFPQGRTYFLEAQIRQWLTADFTKENIWEAFYAQMPANTGASPIVNTAVMTITPQARALASTVFDFLKSMKVVQGELASDAIDPTLVAQAFTELGLDPKHALFEIKGGLPSDNPFNKDELKKR